MLEVKAVKKTYGDFSVSLDFSVAPGETLALVGPSGSGKTTALNLVTGLAEPESGEVLLNGIDITRLPPWKRNISVVFQDLALFPHLDVGGNIAYGLFIRKVPRKERRRIIGETLELVRLPGYASRRVHTLSGGERQRVAIARALASSPGALFLDEPFSSLDAPLRKTLRREFKEIRAQSNAPCVFITHDREEAVMLGDRVALMEEGRIIETGPGKDILLAPETEKAARFFGAGSVLPCRPLGKNGAGIEVSSPLGILTVPHIPEYTPSVLFVPGDAVVCERLTGGEEWKPFNARFTDSLFEGQGITLKLLLDPRENGDSAEGTAARPATSIPFEVNADLRMKPPAGGSIITLWVNQNLLRFVKANLEN